MESLEVNPMNSMNGWSRVVDKNHFWLRLLLRTNFSKGFLRACITLLKSTTLKLKNEKLQSSACQEQFLTAAHGGLALLSLVGSQCAYPSRNLATEMMIGKEIDGLVSLSYMTLLLFCRWKLLA